MKSNSMKKLIICLLAFLIIVFIIIFFVIPFSLRNISTQGPLPYGVWQSENPNIILNINPELKSETYNDFPGTYESEGVETDLVVVFATAHKGFAIHLEYFGRYDEAFLTGTYKIRGNKLRYSVLPFWQERTGIKTIVFEKVSDYGDE